MRHPYAFLLVIALTVHLHMVPSSIFKMTLPQLRLVHMSTTAVTLELPATSWGLPFTRFPWSAATAGGRPRLGYVASVLQLDTFLFGATVFRRISKHNCSPSSNATLLVNTGTITVNVMLRPDLPTVTFAYCVSWMAKLKRKVLVAS